jgi:chromate transporter
VGNLTIVVGSRFQGIPGAIAALLGLTAIPVAIVIGLGALYQQYGQIPMVRGIIDGTAAAAAGLIGGMALKMAKPLQTSGSLRGLLFLVLSFIGVGILRWPLAEVMLVLAPLSILAAKAVS